MSVRRLWCLEEDYVKDEEILRLEEDRDKGNEGNIHGVLVNIRACERVCVLVPTRRGKADEDGQS